MALTSGGTQHVPYRDAKLTRILQGFVIHSILLIFHFYSLISDYYKMYSDSLGGNCKTTLVTTVTPVANCYTESMNSLKFAKRYNSCKIKTVKKKITSAAPIH